MGEMDGRSEREEEGWSSDTVLCRGSVSKGQARSCSKLPPNAQPDVATGSGGRRWGRANSGWYANEDELGRCAVLRLLIANHLEH